LTVQTVPAAANAGSAACPARFDGADFDDFAHGANAQRGHWRFVLSSPSGERFLEAADDEDEASSDRLELLAVVRGLEDLEQPSRVTIMASSLHLRRGLESGLNVWRENAWHWERYGQMTPVKNSDLWRRIDRLLDIHVVQCRPGRLDKADDLAPPPAAVAAIAHRRPGARLRVDPPARRRAKIENRSAKHETSSKHQAQKSSSAAGLRHSQFALADLCRACCFVLRALVRRPWLRCLPSE
jgi:ribonuclease HI